MTANKKAILCDFCEEGTAIVLCPECSMCYCNKCSELTHNITAKKGHKREAIPEGVGVKINCPIHKKIPLELFCIDEKRLCCSTCMMENLHKGHKVVRVSEVAYDNGTFSAEEVRKGFNCTLNSIITLINNIDKTIEDIKKDIEESKGSIKKTFDEEHKKLEDEEKRLMKELEEEYNKATGPLQEILNASKELYKCNILIDEADKRIRGKCSRLMELNIVNEMEKQRIQTEKLLKTEMGDLKTFWDREARKLSFTRNLFNGGPVLNGPAFPIVKKKEIDISWSFNENEVGECVKSKLSYVVELKNSAEKYGGWRGVYSGKGKRCHVTGLEEGTEYDVRVKCVVGEFQGNWSKAVRVETKKTPNIDSSILSGEGNRIDLSDILGEWCGMTDFELIYRGSRDGFKANDFNRTCTNRGKTVTLVKNTSGHIFGGFASISWENSSCGNKQAPGSFLFTLKNMYGIQPTKFSLIDENSSAAVHNVTPHGPVFGAHPRDIVILNNCDTGVSSWAKFPCSYNDVTGKGKSIFTSNPDCDQFQVQEIEVYKVNP